MKLNGSAKSICILLILTILGSGCASTTVLRTTPDNADVYIKGQKLGTTPYTYTDRKISGSSTLVTFKKEGYEDYLATLKRKGQLNVGALFGGLFLIYPYLWILSYDFEYSYDFNNISPFTESVPDYDLPEMDNPVKSPRVEKLLAQGNIEKAIEYSEKQEGVYQANCYFTIGGYYLDNGDYITAEDFYNRSGKVKEGYLEIAESLMRGEVIDSVLTINSDKVKAYLGKVYDNETDVLTKMAVSFEKHASESKKRNALAKSMKEMGMISMSSGGKAINIDNTLLLSQIQIIFYTNSAIQYYKQLGNVKKVEELENEIKVVNDDFPEEEQITQKTTVENIADNLTKEDARIILTIDSVVTTNSLPENLQIALNESISPSSAGISSRENIDYILVYYRITEKIKLNVGLNQPLPRTNLVDKSGKLYRVILERGQSHIRIAGKGMQMWNPAGSQKEGIIIDNQYMFFQMPKGATPSRILQPRNP